MKKIILFTILITIGFMHSIKTMQKPSQLTPATKPAAAIPQLTDKQKIEFLTALKLGKLPTIRSYLSHYPGLINATMKDFLAHNQFKLNTFNFPMIDSHNFDLPLLHYVLMINRTENTPPNKEIIELLLKAGANVNTKNKSGNDALSYALYFTDDVPVLTLLINKTDNINSQNNEGMTPLMIAALLGRENAVQLLISAYPKINLNALSQEERKTSYLGLLPSELREMVSNSLYAINPNLRDNNERTALDYATEMRGQSAKYRDREQASETKYQLYQRIINLLTPITSTKAARAQ